MPGRLFSSSIESFKAILTVSLGSYKSAWEIIAAGNRGILLRGFASVSEEEVRD